MEALRRAVFLQKSAGLVAYGRRAGEGWGEMYAALAEGLPVVQCVDEAVEWVNRLVAEIDGAR